MVKVEIHGMPHGSSQWLTIIGNESAIKDSHGLETYYPIDRSSTVADYPFESGSLELINLGMEPEEQLGCCERPAIPSP
jgi:hypothetical protein